MRANKNKLKAKLISREIVAGNLEMLDSYLASSAGLMAESMAGNAKRWYGLPCLCANFCYDCYTGEFKYLGNDAEEEIAKTYFEGYMKFVWNPDNQKDFGIVGLVYSDRTDEAEANLEATRRRFNRNKRFNADKIIKEIKKQNKSKLRLKKAKSRSLSLV